jgi:hypothetical protein
LSAVRAPKEPEFIWGNFNMSEKLKQKGKKIVKTSCRKNVAK